MDADQTVTFINSGVDGYFEASGNEIIYTTGSSWFDSNAYSSGQNLSVPSLDVVLAHEFGHSAIGQAAFGLTPIQVRTHSWYDSTTRTYNNTFNLGDIKATEIRASQFENRYRSYRGLELRRAYGDWTVIQ